MQPLKSHNPPEDVEDEEHNCKCDCLLYIVGEEEKTDDYGIRQANGLKIGSEIQSSSIFSEVSRMSAASS